MFTDTASLTETGKAATATATTTANFRATPLNNARSRSARLSERIQRTRRHRQWVASAATAPAPALNNSSYMNAAISEPEIPVDVTIDTVSSNDSTNNNIQSIDDTSTLTSGNTSHKQLAGDNGASTQNLAIRKSTAAFNRLYNATTAASKHNKWSVHKRKEEERKKKLKLDPTDSTFLSYGNAIIKRNRKQCSKTIPRKKAEKSYRTLRDTTKPVLTPHNSRPDFASKVALSERNFTSNASIVGSRSRASRAFSKSTTPTSTASVASKASGKRLQSRNSNKKLISESAAINASGKSPRSRNSNIKLSTESSRSNVNKNSSRSRISIQKKSVTRTQKNNLKGTTTPKSDTKSNIRHPNKTNPRSLTRRLAKSTIIPKSEEKRDIDKPKATGRLSNASAPEKTSSAKAPPKAESDPIAGSPVKDSSEATPKTPPSSIRKNSISGLPSSIQKKLDPSMLSGSMSPLTPDFRNRKLRSVERNDRILDTKFVILGKESLHHIEGLSDDIKILMLGIPEESELEYLFQQIDENSIGKLSLVELHAAVQILYPNFDISSTAFDSAYKSCRSGANTSDESGIAVTESTSGFVEQNEFFFFIHYMVYYHNLSIYFSLTSTETKDGSAESEEKQTEEENDRTISREVFSEVAQNIKLSNLLLLKDGETDANDLFDSLNINGEDKIQLDALCYYLAVHRSRSKEQRMNGEEKGCQEEVNNTLADEEAPAISSEEELSHSRMPTEKDKSSKQIDSEENSECGSKSPIRKRVSLLKKIKSGIKRSSSGMGSVDESMAYDCNHSTETSNGSDRSGKNGNGVTNMRQFFENQKESEFIQTRGENEKRKNLFKPKTWRESFYKNKFITLANTEQESLPLRGESQETIEDEESKI